MELKIEFATKFREFEGKKNQKVEYLIVNGIADEDSSYNSFGTYLYDDRVIDILIEFSFEDVGKYISNFKYYAGIDEWDEWLHINVKCHISNYNHYEIEVPLTLPDWETWAKPWSIAELNEQFQTSILDLGNSRILYFQEDSESILNGFGIKYFSNSNSIIGDEIDDALSILSQVVLETTRRLQNNIDKNAYFTYFTFPDEIRVACTQYLIYFSQFLSDIGIAANAEVKNEVSKTLFKITPNDEKEGLEKIKDALSTYLSIPFNEKLELHIEKINDISARQLLANVYHLKSQLLLANSVIESKNATIESLQLSNFQYKQIIDSDIKNSSEDIVKGVISVKKYEGNGFSVDFAEILRKLKRALRK